MNLKPKNWDKFQHYKDRCPPWIKLHRDLLDNRNYWKLSPVAAKYLPLIWLISSEKDGFIPEVDDLAFRLRINESEVSDIIDELTKSEFLVSVDDSQAEQITSNTKFVALQNGFGSRHISDKTKRFVWTRDEGKCQYCNATKDIEYDHITPVSKGGNSDIDNIQLLCRPCNRKKRAKTAEQVDTESLSSRILETETETETETERETEGETEAEMSLPKTKKSTATPKVVVPADVPATLWADFLAVRKAKNAALTETALEGIKREAAKAGKTLPEALTICCERGWAGFNAKWLDKDVVAPTAAPDWLKARKA